MRDRLGSSALDTVESGLRRVRLLAALVVLVQLVGNRSPHGASPLFAVAVVAAVGAVNVVSMAAGRSTWRNAAVVLGAAELVADAVLTLYLVAGVHLFGEDIVWALLVVPVLEGALRFRMRGAVLTWAGVAAIYVASQVTPLPKMHDAVSQAIFLGHLQAALQRVSIVLLVAVPGGYLSEQLLRAIGAQRRARQEATTRSALLELVVEAGNRINRLGDEVVDEVVSCAARLGFDVVDICERDSRTGVWKMLFTWAADGTTAAPPPGAAAGGAALAAARQATVIVDGAEGDAGERAALAEAGLGAVVASALRGRDGTTTVLRAGVAAPRSLSVQQVECLELLAGQASVALSNSNLVAQLRDARERLEHQAYHDTLTQLPNRALFHQRLGDALAARPRKSQQTAVLFLDLDRFKEVNDSLGHEMGDELLVVVAKRLRASLRGGTLVARNGGDEFTVLATVDSEAKAERMATRICKALAAPVRLAGHEVTVSTSVGIALAETGVESGELLRRADLAMYQAKARGPSRWHVYRPADEGAALERMRLEADLRRALERDQLTLAYQPVVRVSDGAITGVEALVRWKDETRGSVPPDEFIPLAEDTGLILDLGRWVLARACAQARRWDVEFPGLPLSVAVNVSPRQLSAPGFLDDLVELIRTSKVDPKRLVLEITERVLAREDDGDLLAAVQELGVRVAADDFGRGQASISYLQRFNLDVLKIDKALIAESTSKVKSRAIVASIVGLAHELDIQVVAEGVETAEQLERLRKLGCDTVQGYHLHRPLAVADVTALVATQHGPHRPVARSHRHPTRRTRRGSRL